MNPAGSFAVLKLETGTFLETGYLPQGVVLCERRRSGTRGHCASAFDAVTETGNEARRVSETS